MDIVNIKAFNVNYKGHILIESLQDLEDYYEDYRKPQASRSCDSLKDRRMNSRLADLGTSIVWIKTGVSPSNVQNGFTIRTIANLLGEVYTGQLKYLLDGKRIAINLKGGYFPIPDDAVIKRVQSNNKVLKGKFLK